MNELVIKHTTELERKLFKLFKQSGNHNCSSDWLVFIKSLDPKIISVSKHVHTHIAFEGEECKTWFLLKWT